MLDRSDIRKLESVIDSSRKAVVLSHYSPDGDAVGSVVACSEYLILRGMSVTPILPSPVAHNLKFLTQKTDVIIFEEDGDRSLDAVASADLIVCLDISKLQRTEYLAEAVGSSRAVKVLVDHHVRQQEGEFDIEFSTVGVSSTCELLFDLLMEMKDVAGDVSKLSMECASALYTGMMTDTNNFSNSVFPGTFAMGGALLSRGIDKDRIQEQVFKSYSASRMKLMGHLLYNKMHFLPEYGAAYMILTEAEKKQYDYSTGDSEGFVNLPLSIAGVRISALFTETTSGYIRVSLRSKCGTDVNVLAGKWYNGGGHVNASGGRLFIPVDEVGDYFVNSLKDYFGK